MTSIKLEWEETIIYEDDKDNLVSNFSEYFIGETVEDCINEAAENYDWRVEDYDQHNPKHKTPIEAYRDVKTIYISENGVWQDADVGVYNAWNMVVDAAMSRENIFERTRK